MRCSPVLFGLCVLLSACGPSGSDVPPDSDVVGFSITPGDTLLVTRDGVPAQQSYTAQAQFSDGTTLDVTADTLFSVDDGRLGTFDGALFTTGGLAGGRTTVRGAWEGAQNEAILVVRVERARVEEPAPGNAPDLFDAAAEEPSLAPEIVYPASDTMLPPNLGDFEAHWIPGGESDLFEVRLHGEFVDLRVYTAGEPAGGGAYLALRPEDWSLAGESQRGADLTLTVRGLATSQPQSAGTSEVIDLELTNQDVDGGIYYWASSGALPEGIYRHDMARPGEPAEPFYTRPQAGDRCVACHVLSRDGQRMAITYDGGNGQASILDVASRAATSTDANLRWNFATYEPSGGRLLTVFQGTMTLRDGLDGAALDTVPAAGYASHPDFAAAGDAIVYVQVAAPSSDWHFSGGSLILQSFDPVAGTFGAPQTLVEATGDNLYYPTFSPDGKWVLYNRSTGTSYDEATAELFVVPTDGSSPPLRLDSPNVGPGLTNSWARWAPFEQVRGTGAASEPFYWLTFSSKRAFGVRLAGGQPQVWMAPFFPERALAGADPSAPAFRLPFQDLGTNNHIAQWTETVIPID